MKTRRTRRRLGATFVAIFAALAFLIAACGQETETTAAVPVINDFSASPASIEAGSSSTLAWSVEDGDSLSIDQGVGDVTGVASVSVSPSATTTYTLTATNASGSDSAQTTVTVTSSPEPTPQAVEAVYRDANGNLVEITDEQVRANDFVFYVWLEDAAEGIDPSIVGDLGDPGAPTAEEMDEVAPSQVQNVAAAFIGIIVNGEVFPVIGADLRWDIRDNPTDSVGFGAADDGLSHPGFESDLSTSAVDNQQADTRSNNAELDNERFPVARAGETFPLFNRTGVGSPNNDGFSWVTLYSINDRDSATLVALAEIHGTEVASKRLVDKVFAPQPDLEITKTVDPDNVVLDPATGDLNTQPTFTVTVTNNGNGDAVDVQLTDRNSSGNPGPYSITPPAGTTPVNQDADEAPEGFDATFDLAAGASRTFTFDADASAEDTYCNLATVVEYSFGVGETLVTEESGISDEACFVVNAPELNIIKDFADGSDTKTIQQGETATLRVRLINNGSAAATGISLTDRVIDSDDPGPYSITAPDGTTGVDQDEDGQDEGFDDTIDSLAAGDSITYTFPVTATADGEYCDVAAFTADVGGSGEDQACLIVATPDLGIEKTNEPTTVLPGDSYESTITVSNTGQATATGVLITDRIGYNSTDDVYVEYESSTFNGASGTFDSSTQTVTAPSEVDIAPGDSVTFTVTSRVPAGSPPGEYCDVAAYTSDNAGDGQVERCITVPAFAALQTQFVDEEDPTQGGTTIVFSSTLLNEPRSNESVTSNDVEYVYDAGDFTIDGTRVYFDSDPTIDPNTGLVTSGPADADSQLTQGTDFTVTSTGTGQQTLVINMDLGPDQAFYVSHDVTTSSVSSTTSYESTYEWTPVGNTSGTNYTAPAGESTTVTSP